MCVSVSGSQSLMKATVSCQMCKQVSQCLASAPRVEFMTTNHSRSTYAVKHMHGVVSIEELKHI